jgi:glycine cleavage system H protein
MSRYFTKEHEWVEVEGDVGTVGISDYAQSQLGDITFVEMPAVGAAFRMGDAVAVVDSVKAASDVYVPVAGSVIETNAALEDEPELVNTDPDTGGWLFRIKLADLGQLSSLMDETAYKAYIAEL